MEWIFFAALLLFLLMLGGDGIEIGYGKRPSNEEALQDKDDDETDSRH